MKTYQPYQNNPKSVMNWLSSHMALQYNWQMFKYTFLILVITVGSFYVNFEQLSIIQNLIFHSVIFFLAIFSIIWLIIKNKPMFVPFDELDNFRRKEVYIFGQEIIWIIYFMLNHRESTLDNKIKESLSSPIELLENMDNFELAQETYWLIEEEGGLTPRVVEPFAIAVIAMVILSQWFFVKCLVNDSGALIYEPNWLKWFLDWFMSNHVGVRPFTEMGKGLLIFDLRNSELMNELNTFQKAIQYPLFRSSVLYHMWIIMIIPITLIYLFKFFYYRRNIISYDKVIPKYNERKIFRYISMFFVYLICFALLTVSFLIVESLSMGSIETNSILPFCLFILMQSFFFLLAFYSIDEFIHDIYNKFFN